MGGRVHLSDSQNNQKLVLRIRDYFYVADARLNYGLTRDGVWLYKAKSLGGRFCLETPRTYGKLRVSVSRRANRRCEFLVFCKARGNSSTNVLRLEGGQANGHPGLVTFLIRPARRPRRVEVSADLWPVGIDGTVYPVAKLAYQSRATRARLVRALHDEADAAEPLS
jgi:hypothetical protein